MFYALQILMFVGTIATVAFVRGNVRARWPRIGELHLDVVAVTIAFIAFVASFVEHHYEARDAAEVQRTVEAVKRYGEIAHMDPRGRTFPLEDGGILTQHGPLIDALDGAWIKGPGGDLIPSCDAGALKKFATVATTWPDVPWGHMGLAFCAICRGDRSWHGYAARAVEIFQATTLLAGHHPSHDIVLKNFEKWIDEKADKLDHPSCPKGS